MLRFLVHVAAHGKRRLRHAAYRFRAPRNSVLRELNSRLSAEDAQAAAVRTRSMPTMLHLQTTRQCNFRCIMCARFTCAPGGNQPWPNMPTELLRKIAREAFAHAGSVELSTSGEPLLAPSLRETLRLARFYGAPVEVTTNGSLLSRPGMLDLLVPVLRRLSVSLDAATSETLQAIRPGACFDDIVAALARCNRMRHERHAAGYPFAFLAIGATLMRRNIHELPDMVRLAHGLGLDELLGWHMVVNRPELEDESLINHPQLFDAYRAQAVQLAAHLGIQVVLPPPLCGSDAPSAPQQEPPPPGAIAAEPLRCPFVYRSVFIDTGGNVVPCCRTGLPVMGNVSRSSLGEIWNGEPYLRLRQALRDGKPPDFCQGCHVIAEATKLKRHKFAA